MAAALGRFVWDGTSGVVVIVGAIIVDVEGWDQMSVRHCTLEEETGGWCGGSRREGEPARGTVNEVAESDVVVEEDGMGVSEGRLDTPINLVGDTLPASPSCDWL